MAGCSINSQEVKKIRPRLLVYDVPAGLPEAEVVEAIRCQNTEYEEEEFKNKFKIVFKTGRRDRASVHYVVECTKDIRDKFLGLGKVYIDYVACNIRDFINLRQCITCLGVGTSWRIARGRKFAAIVARRDTRWNSVLRRMRAPLV